MRWLRTRVATLTLGLRLLRGASFWRSTTIALSAAISTTLFLVAVVGPGVFAAREKRQDAISPVYAWEADLPGQSSQGDGRVISLNKLDSASTLMSQSEEIEWSNGRAGIIRLAGSGPVPPGIDRLPRVGEAWVSPALNELIKSSPVVRKYVGAETLFVIDEIGLTNPQQQLAYVGAPASEVEGWIQKHLENSSINRAQAISFSRIVSWGIAGWIYDNQGEELYRPADYSTEPVIILIALFVIVIPVLALLGATSRLASGVRERRLAALRLLGVSKRRTNVIAGVESAATALVGVALGVALFEYLRRATEGLVVAGQSWFAEDLAPSLFQLMSVAVGVPLVSLLVTLVPLYRINRNPLSAKRLARAKSPSLWRLVPLLLGVVGLIAASRAQLFDANGSPLQDFEVLEPRWLAVGGVSGLLCAIGVPLGVPVLVRLVSRVVAERSDRAFWLLAGRSSQFDPAGTSRVIATLVMVVLLSSIANTALAIVKQGPEYQAALKQEYAGPALVQLARNQTDAPERFREQLLELPGLRDVVSIRRVWNEACGRDTTRVQPCFSVLIASCQSLKSMDLLVSNCTQGRTYRLQTPRGTPGRFDYSKQPAELEIVAASRIKCKDKFAPECVDNGGFKLVLNDVDLGATPNESVIIENNQYIDGAFLLTEFPKSLEPYIDATQPEWFYVTEPGQVNIAAVSLAARQLDPELAVMSRGQSNLDELSTNQTLVWSLVALVGGIGILALLVTFVDRTIERRRLTILQRVTGVSATDLRRLQLTQFLMPMVFAFPVAALIGIAITRTSYSLTSAREIGTDWSSMLSTLAVAMVAALVVSALSLSVMANRIRPSSLRRE